MRKLGVFNFITLNGFYKGLNEDIGWHKHGAEENAFSEENFFNDLAVLTGYPTEVTDFLNKYVKGIDQLPIIEYFDKIGITFNPSNNTFTVNGSPSAAQLALRSKWSVNF